MFGDNAYNLMGVSNIIVVFVIIVKTIMTYDRNFEAYPVLLISDKSIKTFVNFIKNKTFDNFKM